MDNKNAVTTAPKKEVEKINDPAMREMFKQLKLMIVNGEKLTDQEAAALAQYAIQQHLSPFNQECWYIPKVGPAIGILGLRRKAQEKLGPGHYFLVTFRDVTIEYQKTDPTIGYAFEATLRDTETASKYLAMKVEFLKAGVPESEIIDVLGDKPEWKAVGFWGTGEKNPYRDKHYLPEERAKKRAEALAIKKRFNLSYDRVAEELPEQGVSISESESESVKLESGVVEGSFDEDYQQDAESLDRGPEIDNQYDAEIRSPDEVKLRVLGIAEDLKAAGDVKEVTQGQKGVILSCLQGITAPGDTDMQRHAILGFIFGKSSSKELTNEQWRALAKYIDIEKISTGEYKPKDPIISREINNLLASVRANKQQEALL